MGKEYAKLYECEQGIRKCTSCIGKKECKYFTVVEIRNGVPFLINDKELEKAFADLIDIMEGE
jgi:hypothetical protein